MYLVLEGDCSIHQAYSQTIRETQPVCSKFFLLCHAHVSKDTRLSPLFHTASDGKLERAWEHPLILIPTCPHILTSHPHILTLHPHTCIPHLTSHPHTLFPHIPHPFTLLFPHSHISHPHPLTLTSSPHTLTSSHSILTLASHISFSSSHTLTSHTLSPSTHPSRKRTDI